MQGRRSTCSQVTALDSCIMNPATLQRNAPTHSCHLGARLHGLPYHC